MFISVIKTFDSMAERGDAHTAVINSDHIVTITPQPEGSMITLSDGSFIIVDESTTDLYLKLEYSTPKF